MQKQILAVLLLWAGLSLPVHAQYQHIWLEAETGAEKSPIVVKSDLRASQAIYLASWKWADYTNRSRESGVISFEFYVPEAGDYTLWALARLPFSGISPYDVSFGSGDFYDASQWTAWKSANSTNGWAWSDSGVTQYFAKGMHQLHLVQRAGGPDVHLDKVLLTNDRGYVPSGAGGKETTVAIENPYKANTVEKYGKLRVSGGQLTSQNGQAVQLKGISAHGLQWFPLVDDQTIPYMAEFFGAEAVRLAMYIEDYAPTDPSDFWGGYMADPAAMQARVEQAIDDAVNAGVYVLVDWHIHNTPSKYTAEAKQFFSRIARKYGHLPNIIYEIANEPTSVTWSSGIKPYANEVISAIRQHDPDNIVIIGTPNWSQDVDAAARDPLQFDNVMYAFHFYAGTHDINTMKNKVQTALNAGLAIFVSEWGSSDVGTSRSNFAVANEWMSFMNQHKLSWINWSLGNKDENSSILKPEAPLSGPWTNDDLTQAGAWLKPFFNSPQAATGHTAPDRDSSHSTDQESTDHESADHESTDSSSGSSDHQSGTSNPGERVIEAESAAIISGDVRLVDNNSRLGYFDQGEHFAFTGVDLTGAYEMVLRMATSSSGVVEFRADGVNGPLLATLNVTSTGGYGAWQDKTLSLSGTVSGVHDLYVVGKSGYGLFNLDRITVRSKTTNSGTSKPDTSGLTVEAESFFSSANVQLVNNNGAVGYFDQGDHVGYRAIDLSGAKQVQLKMATAYSGGVVEIRAGGTNGTLLASFQTNSTGGFGNWRTLTVNLNNSPYGFHDLFIVGKSGYGLFNLDKFTIVK